MNLQTEALGADGATTSLPAARLKTSVLIPTRNRKAVLEVNLPSVFAQFPPVFEVIVVDNGSSDDTVSWLKGSYPDVLVIELNANLGIAHALNVAVEASSGDCLFVMNDDVWLEPSCVDGVVRAMEADPGLGAVQPLICLQDDSTLVNTSGHTVHFTGLAWCGDYRQPRGSIRPRQLLSVSGSCMSLRRAAFASVGGYDAGNFQGIDDLDLTWRMRLAGWRLSCAPEAVCYHDYVFGWNKFLRYDHQRLAMIYKHFRLGTLLAIAPALIAVELGMLGVAIRRGFLGDKLAGYRRLAAARTQIRAERRAIQSQRVVGDRQLTALLSGGLEGAPVGGGVVGLGGKVLAAYWRLVRPFIRW